MQKSSPKDGKGKVWDWQHTGLYKEQIPPQIIWAILRKIQQTHSGSECRVGIERKGFYSSQKCLKKKEKTTNKISGHLIENSSQTGCKV